MKKFFIASIIGIAFLQAVNAQEIGVRFGDIVGNNIAIDLVFPLNNGRSHLDVSFGDGIGLEALQDFLVKPLAGEAFNYYIGVGFFAWMKDPWDMGLCGELGIEYKFHSLPIALGADWRPSLSLLESTDFHAERFGLNVRYVF